MAGRDEDLDPRFDPLFQRGYDPAQHRTRVRPPAPAPAAPPAPARAETSRGDSSVPDIAPEGGTTVPSRSAEGEGEDEAEAQPEAELEYEPPRRNPFRLAL